jgi:hypothetical protein
VIGPKDLVVTISAGELKHLSCYLEYYLGCRTVDLLGLFFGAGDSSAGANLIPAEMKRIWPEGGEVFLVSEALGTPLACQQIAKYKGISSEEARAVLEKFLSEYRMTPVVFFSGEPLIYRLEPADY